MYSFNTHFMHFSQVGGSRAPCLSADGQSILILGRPRPALSNKPLDTAVSVDRRWGSFSYVTLPLYPSSPLSPFAHQSNEQLCRQLHTEVRGSCSHMHLGKVRVRRRGDLLRRCAPHGRKEIFEPFQTRLLTSGILFSHSPLGHVWSKSECE